MTLIFSNQQIESLVREPKPLPVDWRKRIQLRSKGNHAEKHLDLTGTNGNEFRLILRRNEINPLDFSIILVVRVPNSSQRFRLRRYNGKSHEHKNHIENEVFFGFHIHFSTERYQKFGMREDAYAELTERYSDFGGAFDCMINDVNLQIPFDSQRSLDF